MRASTFLALAIFTGCLQTPDYPELPPCTGFGCPAPPQPGTVDVCPGAIVLTGTSTDRTDLLVGDRADTASCGTGETAGFADYRWFVPVSGQYRIAVHAMSPVVVDVRGGDCTGDELACNAADDTAVDRALPAGEAVEITVAGSGSIELTIEKLPDVCGDGLCGTGEDSTTCAIDCPVAFCGDGLCEAGEDASTCALDCDTGDASDTCGDGVCGATESSGSCPWDCGAADTCGDGLCSGGESSASCPWDCGSDDGSGDEGGAGDGGDDGGGGGDDGGADDGGSDDGGDDCTDDDCFTGPRHAHHHHA